MYSNVLYIHVLYITRALYYIILKTHLINFLLIALLHNVQLKFEYFISRAYIINSSYSSLQHEMPQPYLK